MRRVTINFLIDAVSFAVLIFLALTGFILKAVLPPGTGGIGREITGGRGREEAKELLSLGRHDWGDIHFYLATAFLVLMVVHIVMHWGWIKGYIKRM